MAAESVNERQTQVEGVLRECGVDLRSRVYFSNDPVMVNQVIPRLDVTNQNAITGMTKHLLPFPFRNLNEFEKETRLQRRTTVPWHCHKEHAIRHDVVRGHVVVERLKKDGKGEPILEKGKFIRETGRLGAGGWWWAPPGEPYAYWTEDEEAWTRYRHMEMPSFPKATKCVDPAALENGEPR